MRAEALADDNFAATLLLEVLDCRPESEQALARAVTGARIVVDIARDLRILRQALTSKG